MQSSPDSNASVALFFAGKPVMGSTGIEASFAGEAVTGFQDLITNIWATQEDTPVGSRGPVKEREKAQLHITALLHGSIGFLLEEAEQDYLFPSTLKQATDRATEIIERFTGEDESAFNEIIETVDPRVLGAATEFFKKLHRNEARMRLVEGERDLRFDSELIRRAYSRAESVSIEESTSKRTGRLIGVVPIAGKFEFSADPDGTIIKGSSAATFSESYLQRIRDEKIVGARWLAHFNHRSVIRFGKKTEHVTLIRLDEIHE
jgi:hypothetical protein